MLRIEHIQTAELASRLSLAQHAESCRSQERANQRGLEGRMVSHVEARRDQRRVGNARGRGDRCADGKPATRMGWVRPFMLAVSLVVFPCFFSSLLLSCV